MAAVDEYRSAMNRICSLLVERGGLPSHLRPTVDALVVDWTNGIPDHATLALAKAALWAFLEAKHGDTTTIADGEDRAVRAALCLADPPGKFDASDLEDWAHQMLA